MLTCRQFVEFLDRYVDGRLAVAARTTFEDHLALCESCTRYLDSYRQTIRLARDGMADPESEVPGDVPRELVQAVVAGLQRSGA